MCCRRMCVRLSVRAKLAGTVPNPGTLYSFSDAKDLGEISSPLLLVICHPVARIDIAYSCTKFNDFRFSLSSDMIRAPKCLMGQMT